ncbi:SLC13 family permease [Myxococcus sp. SDU36]|uniref:SLC13 family permease n=1 Tax=Myxococcus sp. SDU36 TaxID=2831967 RepID=UPI0025436018|nr:SLC13 family permease [Myxococcus sp. SDU36]WIG97636.1 permease [Myxococcus sp. SDU36]
MTQAILAGILITALLLQAALPSRRLVVVSMGAGLAALASSLLGTGTAPELLAQVPWDVIVILVTLGLLSQLFVESRLFGVLALHATRLSRAGPRRILLLFAVGMYVVSGLVNNLTALLLVLPVLLILFKLLGVRQRYVSWTLALVLVSCNLGGAATPIGDFPAILLLGTGVMSFPDYLVRALPVTLVALAGVLGAAFLLVRPGSRLGQTPISATLTLSTMGALYRNVRVERRRLLPPLLLLGCMLAAWVAIPRETGVTPDLVAWLGAGVALVLAGGLGERIVRTRIDMEAALFLLSLFVMVGAVGRSGLFADAAVWLQALPISPLAQLCVFFVAAGLLTGVFSAGPSMAALLEVAERLAQQHSPEAVYIGLALSVCAGSSLFLTAATSGPLAQALTERAALRDPEGNLIRFGFAEFLPAGLLSFAVIQTVAIAWGLLSA